jgi:hypothetical protein
MIDQTHLIERFDLDAVKPVPSRVRELDSLALALHQMSLGLSAFRKYIATDLVRGLLDRGVEAKLGGAWVSLSNCSVGSPRRRAMTRSPTSSTHASPVLMPFPFSPCLNAALEPWPPAMVR